MKFIIAVLLLTSVGCATEGQQALGTPEWEFALQRARDNGKLDDSCIDNGVSYELVSDADWAFGDDLGGKTTEAGTVVVRKNGFDGYSASFIMEHEFLHAILDCSGEGDFQNQVHMGHVWDGLRDGDKRR